MKRNLSRLSGEPEFAELAVVGDIGLPQLLRVATRRDWPELAGIVQSALRAIPAKDLDQLHNRWLQPKYPRLSESPGFWQNLSLLFAVLLLASMAIVFWQRRQQHSLEQRLLAAREDIALRAASAEALRLDAVFHRPKHRRHPLGQLGQPCALRQPRGRKHARLSLGRADRAAADRLRTRACTWTAGSTCGSVRGPAKKGRRVLKPIACALTAVFCRRTCR